MYTDSGEEIGLGRAGGGSCSSTEVHRPQEPGVEVVMEIELRVVRRRWQLGGSAVNGGGLNLHNMSWIKKYLQTFNSGQKLYQFQTHMQLFWQRNWLGI